MNNNKDMRSCNEEFVCIFLEICNRTNIPVIYTNVPLFQYTYSLCFVTRKHRNESAFGVWRGCLAYLITDFSSRNDKVISLTRISILHAAVPYRKVKRLFYCKRYYFQGVTLHITIMYLDYKNTTSSKVNYLM